MSYRTSTDRAFSLHVINFRLSFHKLAQVMTRLIMIFPEIVHETIKTAARLFMFCILSFMSNERRSIIARTKTNSTFSYTKVTDVNTCSQSVLHLNIGIRFIQLPFPIDILILDIIRNISS